MTEIEAPLTKSINAYNEIRPHASCDFLTPNQAHKGSEILVEGWKNNNAKKKLEEAELLKLQHEIN